MSGKGKEGRVPQIRFAGFTDPWEQRKFSDLVEVCSGRDYKHLHEGAVPVYGTGGYMTSVDEALSYDKDAIGIGRKGTIDKPYRLRAPFWTVDTLFYCIPYPGIDINFALCCFSNVDWKNKDESTGLPSLSKEAINEAFVCLPSADEQIAIGHHFTNLDNLITLHQRKYDKLCEVKKSMLDKMFPKGGSLYPEIRFAGFTDPWEQRRLGGIYGSIGNAFVGTATPYYVEQGHFYLESNNVKDGQINHNSEIFINDEFYEKQKDKWLHTGDMVMVQSGHVGHAAVIPEELDNTAAHALIMFRNPKEEIEPYFLNYEYQTDKAKKKIENITTGNTIKHILASDMQEFIVDVPKYEEQKVIAGYFRNLDHLITLHQRKLELLRNIKRAMLDKMFA
ncbi:restriction endonuclease subunit S [Bifidobacterium dentium]|uniref:restriction endonuclease subunit S n=1 Tax=Bifidobacterium dentium TaxID=1689 RepID=UPI0018B08D68|nr:restriction endonuclease subunit S [Bifidobacterium dentium]MBF9669070.1 restriction endonuclease subunit S [Bifidobacterium dentium]